MRIRILGSAAGGGAPQWNCACATCESTRRAGTNRLQDTVAVSGDGSAWYLLNASPDIRTQIIATPDLAPGPGLRETPLRGVLLTTAELDHTLGLLSLREAVGLTVYATPAVTAALTVAFPLAPTLAHYTDLDWRVLTDKLSLDGGLEVTRLTVGAKRPRYAAGVSGEGWTSALRLTSRETERSFLYATCLPVWTPEFDELVAGTDVALLDGTFVTDDELTRTTGRPGSARSMGHLPVEETRPRFAEHPRTRFLYGHLNNTNPLASRLAGPDIVDDGQEI